MNDIQIRNSKAWLKLCEYIELVNRDGIEEFNPIEQVGKELYNEIFTLPNTISKLKHVKKISMHGSNLKFLPPEIGQMDSLEFLGTYTSQQICWFPYEIVDCSNLSTSWISLSCLYGNMKTRKPFPDLNQSRIRYFGNKVLCSICKVTQSYESIDQYWITLKIGRDDIPLLANICSPECKMKLRNPSPNYINYPHKGGRDLIQPPNRHEMFMLRMKNKGN